MRFLQPTFLGLYNPNTLKSLSLLGRTNPKKFEDYDILYTYILNLYKFQYITHCNDTKYLSNLYRI